VSFGAYRRALDTNNSFTSLEKQSDPLKKNKSDMRTVHFILLPNAKKNLTALKRA
tara:strand:+ start:345 stop:509 length:165 start_codon:yes stop_codon:yes gene_type:complete